jgi:AraC family transcriptional regulator of arabinose operon
MSGTMPAPAPAGMGSTAMDMEDPAGMGEAPRQARPPGSALLMGWFREGQGYRTTRAAGSDDWLLILTVAGSGRIRWEGGGFDTRPGDLLLWRPGVRHDYGTAPRPGRWELAWAHAAIPDAWIDLLAWPEPAPGIHLLPLPPGRRRTAARLLAEAQRAAARPGQIAERTALNRIEALLLTCAAEPAASAAVTDHAVQQAMELVLADLSRRWSVTALARAVGLSPSRFAHRFTAVAGLSPQRWADGERLRRASHLLTGTALPVGVVAARVGFMDPLHFSRRFRAVHGCPPRAWRRTGRGRP